MAVQVRVWGDHACFTRPETKVDRVSYPVITPTAARGVVEAIFWKPEITWQVQRIDVLKPIRWLTVRRNEVKNRQWNPTPLHTIEEDRTQRSTVMLRDVDYIITAEPLLKPHVQHEDPQKWRAQFLRRVERGACFHRPYLGIREYAAHFGPVNGTTPRPIPTTADLGRMLLDLDYDDGHVSPRFFSAQLRDGRLVIPEVA